MHDFLLNVVRALADSELDDAKVGEAARVKRVFLDDGLNLFPTRAHRQDDPTVSRYLSTGHEEIA